MLPAAIPDTQSPLGLLGLRGWTAISWGSIENDIPPKMRAIVDWVLHGTVNPPWPSDLAPGICLWTVLASAGGATIKVVPGSYTINDDQEFFSRKLTGVEYGGTTFETKIFIVDRNIVHSRFPKSLFAHIGKINGGWRIKFSQISATWERALYLPQKVMSRLTLTYPKVISPSFLLSASREILYPITASLSIPLLARASIGVATPWLDNV